MCRMVNRKRTHVCGGRYEYRRLGYGAVFFGVYGLVFAWAETAAEIMRRLEAGAEMKRGFLGLGLFALGTAAAYGFLALLERQLRMGFERDFSLKQYEMVRQRVVNGGGKKYSELELVNRMSEELRQVMEWEWRGRTELTLSAIFCVGLFLWLWQECAFLTAALYGLAAGNLAIPFLYSRHITADYKEVMAANDAWARQLQEGVEKRSAIQLLGGESQYAGRYEAAVKHFIKAVKQANLTSSKEDGMKNGMEKLTGYGGYAVIGLFAAAGRIDLTMAAKSIVLYPVIQKIFALIVKKYTERRRAAVARQRLGELEEARTERKKIPDGFSIDMEEVSFGYEKEGQLFAKLSYQVGEGQKILIKGSNGSGKSTLLKLFSGFYCLEQGRISIGGVPAEDISLEWLQDNVFYLPQDNLIIPGTVRENLELRSLPCEGGGWFEKNAADLSEGQKRKISLYELYRTHKKILLLDEPENHLEQTALRELKEYLQKTAATVIVVTHGDCFDQMADQIWQLGQQTGEGSL